MATPATKPSSNGAPTPAHVKKIARVLLTQVKDVERTIALYAGAGDKEGLAVAAGQLRLLRRTLDDVGVGVELLLKG